MSGIADLTTLRDHFGAIGPLAAAKVMPRLDSYSRAFIGLSPFLVLSTTDGDGGADASPRGDPPGFVSCIDDTTLLIPDRPGNHRVDSYSNVVKQPGVGLLFFVPGMNETLRVNGRGSLTTDTATLAPLAAQGKTPTTGLLVAIDEVFFHCGKALMRARLWDGARHIERSTFPSLAKIVAEQTNAATVEAAEAAIAKDYRDELY